MAELKFEGDLSEISDRQLEYIKNIIIEKGYKNNKVIVEPLGKDGDNFVAHIKRIIIQDGYDTFKMIVKIAPQSESSRNSLNLERLFCNEHYIYTEIFPKLTELEVAADVPPEKRFKYAICYGSSNDIPHEVILLEDLSESNFVTLDKITSLNNDCVKSVLRDFALLHSFSYVLKHNEPELFEKLKRKLYEPWVYLNNDNMKLFAKKVENTFMKIISSDHYRMAIDGAILRFITSVSEIVDDDVNSREAVILHGDVWTNNIMFNCDDKNHIKTAMIDYQGSKVLNPAADILYFIFNCTDYQTRKEHFYSWLDYYHSELDKSLVNHGLKANLFYTREKLDYDLKRYGRIIFGVCIMLAGITLTKTGEEFATNKGTNNNDEKDHLQVDTTESDVVARMRIEGLVDSFREFDLL